MPRVKREVQLHVACTIMKDPHGITKKDRSDNEICQYAAAYKPEHFGYIPRNQVDKVFDDFKQAVLKDMRKHGILRPGQ